jgi:hypothetical protein
LAVAAGFTAFSVLAAEQPAKPKETRPPHPNGPSVAASDMGKMTAATGVEAVLFASEPMVVNPADMDVDERGRVWITEGANYRLAMHKDWGLIRPGGDRIVILEDSNRDGKADKQIVFYQDMTVNTALGMDDAVPIMELAIGIAVAVILYAARTIGEFVDRHPTVKMLALSFLTLVGTALVAEGWGYAIPKGYIYFAMAFSVGVEMLNLRVRARRQDVIKLRKHTPH